MTRQFLFILTCGLVCISLESFASITWTGGSPEGGPVLSVTADPVEPEVLYAGTWAGVYRSTDAGSHWAPVGLPFPDPVFTLAWNTDESRLFAGAAGRIFVTDRTALSWSTLVLPTPGAPPVSAILFDPDSPILFAGTAGQGLFRSDDGGQTWADIGPSAGGQQVRNITDLVRDAASGTVYVATQGGLFQTAAAGLKQVDETSTLALAFRPENGRIYASTEGGLRSGSVETTLWGRIFAWRETTVSGAIPDSILDLWLDLYDPALLWAAALSGIHQGRFQSDAATGKEAIVWTKAGQVDTPVFSIVCPTGEPGRVFAGGMTAFWTTENGGESWRSSSAGIRASRFLDVVPVAGKPATVFGSVLDSPLYNPKPGIRVLRSGDSGITWRQMLEAPYDGGRPSLAIDPGRSGSFDASPITVHLEGKRRSTDLGETWTMHIPFAFPSLTSFYIDPGKPDNQAVSTFYASGFGVHSFIRVTNNGWRGFRELSGFAAWLLRTDPHSPDSVYFSGISHWDGISSQPTGVVFLVAEDLEPDRFVPGRLYIVSDRRLYVYPGADNQAEIADLPPEIGVLTVKCHLTQAGVVAAGTSDGLYLSRDNGTSWEKVTARGLATGQVFGISFDPDDPSTVYVAATRGAFRLRMTSDPHHRRRQPRLGAPTEES